MKNKETVEQAAEKSAIEEMEAGNSAYILGFINGANYQAERMYSEEEVLEILDHHTSYLQSFIAQYIDRQDMEENDEWFKQFKKK